MMIDGIELLAQAGDKLGEVEILCVRVDDRFGVMSLEAARPWLTQMIFFDDHRDPGWPGNASPPGRFFDFQVWTERRIWYPGARDGVASLSSRPIQTTEWLTTMSSYEPRLVYIGNENVWKFGVNVGTDDA